MKRVLVITAFALSVIACNKQPDAAAMKTAYVDTNKLLDEYAEAKDIDAKYKAKADEMGKELKLEAERFQNDAAAFERNARANGEIWARQNSGPLQKRQQELQYAQQAILQRLQQESGVEMDTMVSSVKRFIKEYGKKNGYDYVYGTGEAVSILYAQDKYDITSEIVKALNEKYKSGDAKATTPAKPADTTAAKK